MIDGRTPVIIGVGQVTQRADPPDAREPVELFADAAHAAARDVGSRRDPLALIDTVASVSVVSWPYPDVGAELADRLELDSQALRLVESTTGGNSPQMLVTAMAEDIQRGRRRAVLVGGAECMATRQAARAGGFRLAWARTTGPGRATRLGDARDGSSPGEDAHGAGIPVQVYPLFETARRATSRRSVAEQRDRIGALWSSFSSVAATNPHAWSPERIAAATITTPTAENRLVVAPYTKLMTANMFVDMGSALLLVAYEVAQQLGVAEDRMVFPLTGADAMDHYYFSERDALDRSPAIAAAGRAVFAAAGLGVDDVARFDLYSCFPAAVQIAMTELDLSGPDGGDRRPLTVTGGLTFAGGPFNNYAGHSIAAMVEACRRDRGSVGLVTALGWYVTKHALGLYSSTPPGLGFRRADPSQAAIDALPRRIVHRHYAGPATVESSAVVMQRDGAPELAIVTVRTPDGGRALANTRDRTAMHSMIVDAWEGRAVEIRIDGAVNVVA